MRVIGRIVIILLAALLVAGATYAITQVSQGSTASAAGPGFQPPDGANASFQGARQRPEGGVGGEFRGERRGGGLSIFGAFELLKNLAIVGVVAVLGVLLARPLGLRRARRSRSQEPPLSSSV